MPMAGSPGIRSGPSGMAGSRVSTSRPGSSVQSRVSPGRLRMKANKSAMR